MAPPPDNRNRPQKDFELLALAEAFAKKHGLNLNDPALVEQLLADVAPRLKAALVDSNLLRGARTERLFEATVLSLGCFRLLKSEDAGRVHAVMTYRAPDFRIVLDDGERWLVEVKNVYSESPQNQRTTLSATYFASLQAYADAVGTPLRLAIYWSRWNLWTVIAPDRFLRPNGGLRVTMMEAIEANEFSRLGDVLIGTKAPLRLVLGAASDKPRSIGPEGLAQFIIGSARLYSGEVELTDPRDRRLAEILMSFGEWPTEGPTAIMGDDGIAGVEFVARPEEPSDQGFDCIGHASQIFTQYFASRTLDGAQVIRLGGAPTPQWFAPLAEWDFKRSQLPLWLLRQQPSTSVLKTGPVAGIQVNKNASTSHAESHAAHGDWQPPNKVTLPVTNQD